ncbi:MAG: hydantoinase/oxoprolinase family protein [Anaerolineae bacterium]
MSIRLGVDVGGTFTDLVLIDNASGNVKTAKSSSTPGNPIEGVMEVIRQVGAAHSQIEALVHGTTVATNALLERKGASTGFITTKGFRDVIFIQRMNRKHHYDLTWDKPKLPAHRRDCLEVAERVNYKGEVLEPLDEAGAREVILEFKRRGIEAIAVCFLFSYLHPQHELRMRELIEELYPAAYVSLSHEVYPRWREFERSSTTILDAFLKPLVHQYVHNLHDGLVANQVKTHFLMMKSNGGITDYASVAKKPVDLMVSGPVGGVLAAVYLGNLTGRKNLVATDMGGTSFDVSLIVNGQFNRSTGVELEWGIPIRTAMVDVQTIGAGGGSLAWIDKGGLLRVGPHSAGAKPGPACYGRGGTEPTVTDANLVLGRLDPDRFAGGQFKLDKAAAEAAIARYAQKLNLDIYETAHNIIQLVNWNMVNAIRLVSIDKGHDPRDFTLISFGGAGSAHAAALAEIMDIHEVMAPVHQAALSAFGLTIADMRVDVSQTANMRSDILDLAFVNATLKDLWGRARQTIAHEGYLQEPTMIETIEMRYLGQNYGVEVPLPVPGEVLDEAGLAEVYRRFAAQHEALYGYSLPHEIVEFVNFNVIALGQTHKSSLPKLSRSGAAQPIGSRQVYFAEAGGFVECPIYWRDDLAPRHTFTGPAVVEEDFSLTLLLPGQRLAVDEWGNLIIRTSKGLAASRKNKN